MKVYNENNIQELLAKNPFDSSVILEYRFLKNEGEFIWVSVPVDWTMPRGQRKFIKLVFEQVQNFEHLFPKEPENHFLPSGTTFLASDFPGTYESETAILGGGGDRIYTLCIELPYLLGQIKFEFQKCRFQQKIGLGKQIGVNKWEYHDTETGEVFSFEEPFG
jgi:hypothetical protein